MYFRSTQKDTPSTTFIAFPYKQKEGEGGQTKPKNQSRLINKSGAGYTLIELVVYVAVFAMLSVFVVYSLTVVTTTFLDVRVERNKLNAATVAFERMVRETRLAESVDINDSTFGGTSGRLTLNTFDASDNAVTATFSIENGQLQINKDGATSILTPEHIVIDALTFELITNNAVEGVKMEMRIHDTREDNPDEKTFYNTALLRGSY